MNVAGKQPFQNVIQISKGPMSLTHMRYEEYFLRKSALEPEEIAFWLVRTRSV